jgi:hypothetical protein
MEGTDWKALARPAAESAMGSLGGYVATQILTQYLPGFRYRGAVGWAVFLAVALFAFTATFAGNLKLVAASALVSFGLAGLAVSLGMLPDPPL